MDIKIKTASEFGDCSYNLGKCMVWVNPKHESQIKNVMNMENKRHHRMHIFITSAPIIKMDEFKRFIEAFFFNPFDVPTVTIHVARNMPDLKEVLLKVIIPGLVTPEFMRSRIKVVAERKGPRFRIPDKNQYMLHFEWDGDVLRTSIPVCTYEVNGYEGPFRKFGGAPGAVKNYVQAWFPEHFKEKIITSFKENCPENILKSFKDDEDIWTFIKQEGEWSVKEDQ